jgi:hypothetical protein
MQQAMDDRGLQKAAGDEGARGRGLSQSSGAVEEPHSAMNYCQSQEGLPERWVRVLTC